MPATRLALTARLLLLAMVVGADGAGQRPVAEDFNCYAGGIALLSRRLTSSWRALPQELQLLLSRAALRRAAETLAAHAELLAQEMEAGTLADQGGPEALRLFAAVVRASNADAFGPTGHA